MESGHRRNKSGYKNNKAQTTGDDWGGGLVLGNGGDIGTETSASKSSNKRVLRAGRACLLVFGVTHWATFREVGTLVGPTGPDWPRGAVRGQRIRSWESQTVSSKKKKANLCLGTRLSLTEQPLC